MKKTLQLIVCGLFACVVAFALTACGGGVSPDEGITFKNDLDTTVEAVFISSPDVDTWGDSALESSLNAGKSVVLDASVLPSVSDDTYDVGVLDEDNLIYEFYRVPIVVSNKLTIFTGDDGPTLVVTDSDGNDTAIDGSTYPVE